VSLFQDFPDLAHIDRETDRAALLLEQAAESVTDRKTLENEGYADRAQRLKGAAVIASAAVAELFKASGWYEAAEAANEHGLLEGES